MIHTFGDSHAVHGFRDIIDIKTHGIGPSLCYSFGRDKLKRLNIKNFGVKDGDTVVFCFGEIDCRNRVHKLVTDDVSHKEVINEIIEMYFEAILENIIQFDDLRVCVYNVVPPIHSATSAWCSQYPFEGSDSDRQKYVLYFNNMLKERCVETNCVFFDVYEPYCDSDGFLKKEMSDGYMHIKDPIYIREFITKNL